MSGRSDLRSVSATPSDGHMMRIAQPDRIMAIPAGPLVEPVIARIDCRRGAGRQTRNLLLMSRSNATVSVTPSRFSTTL